MKIRIFPIITNSVFSEKRLAANRNHIRTSGTGNPAPTPHYNSSILHDTTMISNLNYLHAISSEVPAFAQASMLAKVWLYQRGFNTNRIGYGMNGFLFSMIMGWLYRSKNSPVRIGKSFSCYQMFKVTLDFLSAFDFETKALFLNETGTSVEENEFSNYEFISAFDVSIVDMSGKINLAVYISKSAIREFQYEALLAIGLLNDSVNDNFSALFLTKIDDPLIKFDNIYRIPKILANIPSLNSANSVDFGNLAAFAVREIYNVFAEALNQRCVLLSVSSPAIPSWEVGVKSPNTSREATNLTIGMCLHNEKSLIQVEHGPSNEQVERVQAFRNIWGQKSEVRRFKDGSITESVVFDCDGTMEQRGLLVARMTAYLLSNHFNVSAEQGVIYWSGLGNRFLKYPGIEMASNSFQAVMDSYSEISKLLRSLRELPLSISALRPVSEALRYASVFIPQPLNDKQISALSPMEVIIQFETSGRWPDDLVAIQQMKLAFYVRMAELLKKVSPATKCEISTGYKSNVFDHGFVDITTESAFVFRFRIHHDREAYLLKQGLSQAKKIGGAALEEKKSEQLIYMNLFHNQPYHNHHMSRLSLLHPFLGTTMRLMKRWVASHLLLSEASSSGFPIQILELLCAYVYINASPYRAPASGFSGFMRVLALIATWDWKSEPLIIELEAGKLTSDLRVSIQEKFSKVEKMGAGHVSMFIAHEQDLESKWYNSLSIHIKLVQRLKALSKSALSHFRSRLLEAKDHEVAPVFVTSIEGYSAILHLDPKKLSSYNQNILFDPEFCAKLNSKYKNVPTSEDMELTVLQKFNAVRSYISELTSAFSDVCMFFYDVYGGDKIAILWKPMADSSGFKVNLGYNVLPEDMAADCSDISPNKIAMLAEMQRLGGSLCASVSQQE